MRLQAKREPGGSVVGGGHLLVATIAYYNTPKVCGVYVSPLPLWRRCQVCDMIARAEVYLIASLEATV